MKQKLQEEMDLLGPEFRARMLAFDRRDHLLAFAKFLGIRRNAVRSGYRRAMQAFADALNWGAGMKDELAKRSLELSRAAGRAFTAFFHWLDELPDTTRRGWLLELD